MLAVHSALDVSLGLNGHGKLVSIILLGLTFFYRLLCIRQRLEVVVVE
jgi:hypothetical protein